MDHNLIWALIQSREFTIFDTTARDLHMERQIEWGRKHQVGNSNIDVTVLTEETSELNQALTWDRVSKIDDTLIILEEVADVDIQTEAVARLLGGLSGAEFRQLRNDIIDVYPEKDKIIEYNDDIILLSCDIQQMLCKYTRNGDIHHQLVHKVVSLNKYMAGLVHIYDWQHIYSDIVNIKLTRIANRINSELINKNC